MTDLYLICHKVRGEPAFDVATQMTCSECEGTGEWQKHHKDGKLFSAAREGGCTECDSTGFWWIIPTSGHRAYPWWFAELHIGDYVNVMGPFLEPMPEGLPDHYPDRKAPTMDLVALLTNLPKPKSQPLRRR